LRWAKEGDEKVEKQIAGAKARPDSASVIAGTKVPAYLKASFSALSKAQLIMRPLRHG
jgi:hypothetical protein